MSLTKESIIEEIKALEPREQAKLARAVELLSLGEDPQAVEAEWATEIRRRLAAVDQGVGSEKPVEEVIDRLCLSCGG